MTRDIPERCPDSSLWWESREEVPSCPRWKVPGQGAVRARQHRRSGANCGRFGARSGHMEGTRDRGGSIHDHVPAVCTRRRTSHQSLKHSAGTPNIPPAGHRYRRPRGPPRRLAPKRHHPTGEYANSSRQVDAAWPAIRRGRSRSWLSPVRVRSTAGISPSLPGRSRASTSTRK